MTIEYTVEQRAELTHHIEKYFGPISFIISQVVIKDLKLDIAVIEPSISRNRNFYILVTMGLGAYQMPHNQHPYDNNSNFSYEDDSNDEAESDKVDRCELVMMLDPDFKIPSADEDHYWPVRLLKEISQLAVKQGTYLDWGISYTKHKPFAPDTELCYALLCGLNKIFEAKAQAVALEDDIFVGFYLVLPLYKDEFETLLDIANIDNEQELKGPIDTDSLNKFISQMRFIDPLVNNYRRNGGLYEAEYWSMVCEDIKWHCFSIESHDYQVPYINACSHLAILLGYMYENDMLNDFVVDNLPGKVKTAIAKGNINPLRILIIEEMSGVIDRRYCNGKGLAFLNQYLNQDVNITPRFTADVDSFALRYWGREKYYCKEFNTDGYLFIPFTKSYYKNFKKVIDERVCSFEEQKSSVSNIDEQVSLAMARYLDCDTDFFPKLQNDAPIHACLDYGYRNGANEGYIPVVVEVNQYFMEMAIDLIANLNPSRQILKHEPKLKNHNIDEAYAQKYDTVCQMLFDSDKLKAVRYNCLNTPDIASGSYLTPNRLKEMVDKSLLPPQVLSDYEKLQSTALEEINNEQKQRKKHYLKLRYKVGLGTLKSYNGYEIAEICMGPIDKADNIHLYSYWDENSSFTKPVLVAKIPTQDPTMILPYLAFLYPSGENLVPLELVELAKHFWQNYRAVPAVISVSGIEFNTCKPLTKNKALLLAYDILVLGDYIPKDDLPYSLSTIVPILADLLENKDSFFFPVITPTKSDI